MVSTSSRDQSCNRNASEVGIHMISLIKGLKRFMNEVKYHRILQRLRMTEDLRSFYYSECRMWRISASLKL